MVKNEALWRDLTTYLTRSGLAGRGVDIIHAQHVMTTVPSVRAGAATGTPVVATVRDYWPVCYWSDLIYDPSQPQLCPVCSARMMTECVKPRAGARGRGRVAAHSRTCARTFAPSGARWPRPSAIIAVSSTIARDLRARAPELAATPLYTIPNPVDMTALDAGAGVGARRSTGRTSSTRASSRRTRACSTCSRQSSAPGVDLPLVDRRRRPAA